jgi:hypothetical protein
MDFGRYRIRTLGIWMDKSATKEVNVEIKLFLSLTKHHAKNTYWRVEKQIAPRILDLSTRRR